MKILCTIAALTLLCAPLTHQVTAQTPSSHSAEPACEGVINIIRLSEITPTGSMDKLMAAVAAHQAWYKNHGYSDVIAAARVLQRDPKTHAMSYSNKQVITFHYQKPGSPSPTQDAAWNAYVKMYNETSTIKETTVSCVPLVAAPASMQ